MTGTPTVNVAWANVMEEVRSVGKGDFNEDQGFRFRGVDSVVNAVGPALRAHQVAVIPKRIVKIERTEYATRRGTRMVNKEVTVEWEVRGPAGDSFTGEAVGEAADAGDKSISKAQSVSYRVFLIESLCIPTGTPDPDSESHERVTAPPTPIEEALEELGDAVAALGLNPTDVAAEFYKVHKQTPRGSTPEKIRDFINVLHDRHEAEKGT